MIKNYLLVALRSITRNKLHAFINITGLSIGMACCILIALFVQFELSYDKHNKQANRVHRLVIDLEANNWAISAFPIGQLLQDNFAEVEKYTRIKPTEGYLLNVDTETKHKEKVFYADSSVFDVLDIELEQGDVTQALAQLNSMVMTAEKARIYFGNENPVGKTLTLLIDNQSYKITGIFKPMPSNSHVHPEIMVSSDNFEPMRANSQQGWSYLTNHYTYLVLPENTDPHAFGEKISAFMDKHEQRTDDQPKNQLRLQPLTSIHLHSNRGLEVEANGNLNTVYILSGIAFFILIIACINFMNLTTAQSLKRAREVGIRKVVGSKKLQLVFQFLSESVVISFIALVLSIAILTLIIPSFNAVTGKYILLNPVQNTSVVIIFLAVTFFVGLASGIYPAFFLSAFKPTLVLKGNFVSNAKGQALRKGLVVFQFAIAFVIMVGTFVIYSQLDYMVNKNMGFDREEVLVIRMPRDSVGDESVKQELARLAGVQAVTRFMEMPGKMVRTTTIWYEDAKNNQPENMYIFSGDADLLKTLGMKMKAGDYFSANSQQFYKEFVVNEAAVKHFGWKQDEVVGKLMDFGQRGETPGKVIGVVEDFHFKHLHEEIGPLVMYLEPRYEAQLMAVKVKTDNMPQMISALEDTWKQVLPGREFEYQFLDETFDKLFDQEKRLGQLFGIFSGLAIFISCLGLFGLASFTMEQSRKSIAVRKVLGASVSNITVMMSKDFLRLVLLGILIAGPIAYYFMSKWLQAFAYHVDFKWTLFLYAALAGIGVAFVTVSYHTLKAAGANPVNALKEN